MHSVCDDFGKSRRNNFFFNFQGFKDRVPVVLSMPCAIADGRHSTVEQRLQVCCICIWLYL